MSGWERKLLSLITRSTEEDDLAFVDLVNQVEQKCDLAVCRVLMKTFTGRDDFGVQESVNRVLSSARSEDRQRALLEEFPRLLIEAPDWAVVLLETEVRFHRDSFISTLSTFPNETKQGVVEILQKQPFSSEFSGLPNLLN